MASKFLALIVTTEVGIKISIAFFSKASSASFLGEQISPSSENGGDSGLGRGILQDC